MRVGEASPLCALRSPQTEMVRLHPPMPQMGTGQNGAKKKEGLGRLCVLCPERAIDLSPGF
jgi:hypothetical protein